MCSVYHVYYQLCSSLHARTQGHIRVNLTHILRQQISLFPLSLSFFPLPNTRGNCQNTQEGNRKREESITCIYECQLLLLCLLLRLPDGRVTQRPLERVLWWCNKMMKTPSSPCSLNKSNSPKHPPDDVGSGKLQLAPCHWARRVYMILWIEKWRNSANKDKFESTGKGGGRGRGKLYSRVELISVPNDPCYLLRFLLSS